MPNSNPTIERMMLILEALEGSSIALSQAELVEQTGLARSTVYRMLNSLTECGLLREVAGGRFSLGGRLLQFADKITPDSDFISKVRFLQPILDKLASDIGQTCKISVFDRGAIMVVAGALARTPHAMSFTIGEYLPLHAGGASKVLMAALDEQDRRKFLSRDLPALSEKTITDSEEFEREIATVRRNGWSEDRGEYSTSVCSFAAPILDGRNHVIAALSVPFVSTTSSDARAILLEQTLAGAEALRAEYLRFT